MPARLLSLWSMLVEPSPAITDPEARRQARFFASFMLLALGFIPAGMIYFTLVAQPFMSISMLVIGLVSLISYLMNRRGWIKAAGLMLVVLLTMILYARAAATSTPEHPRLLGSFSFIVLFSGLFLSRQVTVFIGLLHIGLMLAYPNFADGVHWDQVLGGEIFYHATLIVFALLVSWFIDRRQQLHLTEITASEQRYKELANRHEMQAQWLEEVLSATPDHFVVFDQAGRIEYANAATKHDLGLPGDRMTGKTWAELGMQGPVAQMFDDYLQQMFAGVDAASVDVTDIHNDRHYTLAFRPLHDRAGAVVSAVATRREITPYVEAQRKLTESNERYRIISELISDYAFAFNVDEQGQPELAWITDSFTRVTGYTWEILNATGDILTLYHPEDRAIVREEVATVLTGRDVDSSARIITSEGEVRWVTVRRRAERDPETGRVVRYYGVVQDITEQRKAERQRSRLEAERESLGVIQDFVRAVSHDFRNSLANIETSRYLIHRHLIEPDGNERLLQKSANMHHFVQHLSEQLDNLDTVFSLTRKDHRPLQIAHLLDTVVHMVRPRVDAKAITLVTEIEASLPEITGSVQELTQVVQHLLKNAATYTPAGGTITLSAHQHDGRIVIRVADTGPGIDEAHLPHIFDLFYRADPARSMSEGGVGVGLSIVKLIIDAHNGTVSVDSVPGAGANFTLVLPVTGAAAS